MIIIVDYGMGNLRSIQKKLERLKYVAVVSRNPKEILGAKKIILPGVGYFAQGMKNINEFGIKDALNEAVIDRRTSILGICLGMQLLTDFSEEGNVNGLGWIAGKTLKFNFSNNQDHFRIPHVGWNLIYKSKDSVLLDDLNLSERFYFTHSYAVHLVNQADVVADSEYGYRFASVIQKGNIYGTQFHPEKSHFTGLKILENFLKN